MRTHMLVSVHPVGLSSPQAAGRRGWRRCWPRRPRERPARCCLGPGTPGLSSISTWTASLRQVGAPVCIRWVSLGPRTLCGLVWEFWLAGGRGMAWSAHPLQDAETQVVGPWWLCRGVSGPIIFDACLPSVVFRGLMAEQAPSCCGGAGLRWAGLSEHGRDKVVHPHTAVSAAVTEAKHPLLRGKPLAVCHSASTRGTGEVSTCNYEARR